MNIYDLGWSDLLINKEINHEDIARVTVINRSFCKAMTQSGEINVYLSGRFHSDNEFSLATGDFIHVSPRFIDEQNKRAAVLLELLPRFSKLSRIAAGSSTKEQILATNLNFVFIMTSANDDFSINRLQRFILLAQSGGVTPIVVLSKIDLVSDPNIFIDKIKTRISGVEVLGVSALSNTGISLVKTKVVPGETVAFVGSSGVGKSTLVNQLIGQNQQSTLQIRGDDGKGRHTTTARELFFLKEGGMIIDTAGLREIHVFADDSSSLDSTFGKIYELTNYCKFSDCSHDLEPDCAIQGALACGELEAAEYENYLKLQREISHTERKMNKVKFSNEKKRWKKINQNMRARRKFEGRE